jgi:hypothetical protein
LGVHDGFLISLQNITIPYVVVISSVFKLLMLLTFCTSFDHVSYSKYKIIIHILHLFSDKSNYNKINDNMLNFLIRQMIKHK